MELTDPTTDVDPNCAARRIRMTAHDLVLMLVAVVLAATGQLLLKRGMTLAKARYQDSSTSLLLHSVLSPWVLVGLLIFGCSAIAWLLVLSRVPLSTAYPFNALGYICILAASALLLHERTNFWTWLGTTLVVGGLVVVVTLAPSS